jgi:hypothetical protein
VFRVFVAAEAVDEVYAFQLAEAFEAATPIDAVCTIAGI